MDFNRPKTQQIYSAERREKDDWKRAAINLSWFTIFLSVPLNMFSLKDFARHRLPDLHLLKQQKYFDSLKPIKMADFNFFLSYLKCVRETWAIVIGCFSHMAFSIKMTIKHLATYIYLKDDFLSPSSLPPSFLSFLFLKCTPVLTQFARKWYLTLIGTVRTLTSLAYWIAKLQSYN